MVAVAADWRQWAVQQQLGGIGGNGRSAAATAAALPLHAIVVATKIPAATVDR
jgi:hypothetical protein